MNTRAIGEASDGILRQATAFGHRDDELAVAGVDQVLEKLPFGFGEGPVGRKDVLVEAAFDGFESDADALQQAGNVVPSQDHADRAGDGARIGDDLFGSHSDVDPTGG